MTAGVRLTKSDVDNNNVRDSYSNPSLVDGRSKISLRACLWRSV